MKAECKEILLLKIGKTFITSRTSRAITRQECDYAEAPPKQTKSLTREPDAAPVLAVCEVSARAP